MAPWVKREKRLRIVSVSESGNAEHGMKGFICTQPVGVSKATRTDNRREEKCQRGVGRREGVRAAQPKRHEVLNRVGETNFAEELYQAEEAPKWGAGFGGATKINLARAEKGVDFGVPRFVRGLRLHFALQPHSAIAFCTRRCLF
jgi:hypothetical protein